MVGASPYYPLVGLCLLFAPPAVTHWTPALTPTNGRWPPVLTFSLLLSISSLCETSITLPSAQPSIAWPPTPSPSRRPRYALHLLDIRAHSPGRPPPAHAARPTSRPPALGRGVEGRASTISGDGYHCGVISKSREIRCHSDRSARPVSLRSAPDHSLSPTTESGA